MERRETTEPETTTAAVLRGPDEARELVLEIVRVYADELLEVARRHSLCLDDAQDAYQRALEILLRHAARLDAPRAHRWTFTVVKREAMRLRDTRQRLVGREDFDFDREVAQQVRDPEERVLSFDRLTRSAEALKGLKPNEVRALWQQAHGLTYHEIAAANSWSYTKVNRLITEGRRSFLSRYAGIEAGEECARLAPMLSALVDGEAGAAELTALRGHLRACVACRAAVKELRATGPSLTVLLPAPVVVVAGAPDAAGGLIARVWELLVGPLQERAALSATKLQAAVEATTTGKMAAVAASAAAIAGGGVAAERAADHPRRSAAHAAAPARTAAAPSFAAAHSAAPAAARTPLRARRSTPPARTEFPARTASSHTSAREFGLGEEHARTATAASTEFGAKPARSAAKPAASTVPDAPAAPAPAADFEATTASTPPVGATTTAAAPPAASSAQAAAEFGP